MCASQVLAQVRLQSRGLLQADRKKFRKGVASVVGVSAADIKIDSVQHTVQLVDEAPTDVYVVHFGVLIRSTPFVQSSTKSMHEFMKSRAFPDFLATSLRNQGIAVPNSNYFSLVSSQPQTKAPSRPTSGTTSHVARADARIGTIEGTRKASLTNTNVFYGFLAMCVMLSSATVYSFRAHEGHGYQVNLQWCMSLNNTTAAGHRCGGGLCTAGASEKTDRDGN